MGNISLEKKKSSSRSSNGTLKNTSHNIQHTKLLSIKKESILVLTLWWPWEINTLQLKQTHKPTHKTHAHSENIFNLTVCELQTFTTQTNKGSKHTQQLFSANTTNKHSWHHTGSKWWHGAYKVMFRNNSSLGSCNINVCKPAQWFCRRNPVQTLGLFGNIPWKLTMNQHI